MGLSQRSSRVSLLFFPITFSRPFCLFPGKIVFLFSRKGEMEGGKQMGSDGSGSSSSSFTSELFGSNDLASSSGIFGAIFAPDSSKVVEMNQKEHNPTVEAWRAEPESPDDTLKPKDGQGTPSTDSNSVYRDQTAQPCHLSSSIYYGGQDVYSKPQHSHESGFNSTKLKKDGGEDDSGSAPRGNWWQGSLYY